MPAADLRTKNFGPLPSGIELEAIATRWADAAYRPGSQDKRDVLHLLSVIDKQLKSIQNLEHRVEGLEEALAIVTAQKDQAEMRLVQATMHELRGKRWNPFRR